MDGSTVSFSPKHLLRWIMNASSLTLNPHSWFPSRTETSPDPDLGDHLMTLFGKDPAFLNRLSPLGDLFSIHNLLFNSRPPDKESPKAYVIYLQPTKYKKTHALY